MLKYLKDYVTCYDTSLNIPLMKKSYDKPLLDFVLESWKSLEVMNAITILGYTYTDKESEINVNRYTFKRERGKKQKERYDYKYIDDSRLGLLTVEVLLQVPTLDPRLGKEVVHEKIIKKSMLIPLQDENGMYYLNGKEIFLIYQKVEKSTYTASNSVILKSLMPFAIRRYVVEAADIHGTLYRLPYYTIELFERDVEVMLVFATEGLHHAIQFALDYPYIVMDFVTEPDEDDVKHLFFQISATLYLKVNRSLFEQFQYVKATVGGIIQISTNRLTIDKLDDREIWLKHLGQNNVAKGVNLLERAQRLIDRTTARILRLDEYHKSDVLSLTRWMCEEYNDLRMKDNMHLENSRLRSNEILEALLTLQFSERANRIMSLGKKATIENYQELFSFDGSLLVQAINTSGIQRYNECINDLDFFSKFKYTIKGPNSLGNKNSNNIGVNLYLAPTSLIAGNF